ncbi:periplasmic heavy metal sensor [Phaeobacter porticola]|uniref:Putative integral membrane protein n=1 Tax=Phaeobacter porticola TaxID=1844006 RepID=A0A1L3I2B6_9RHOB|nr:periplasmic heavy metal sensor [Phaeobacter porticola]APG46253.1 putative integral membrane protein [Phaeobacter porticola]
MMIEQAKPMRRRWLLIASLALNLVVIGVAVGAAWRYAGHDKARLRMPPVGALLFRDLDAGTRQSLRSKAEGDHGSYHARRRAEGARVVELLRATPFEAAALGEMLNAQAERRHSFQRSVQEAWLGKIEAMSAEERADYADRLQHRVDHPKRRKWRE